MKTQEKLSINTNVDQQDKNDYAYKVEHVENTPFSIITKDEEYFGVIGNHRITEIYKIKEALEIDLLQTDWNKIVQVIYAIVEQFNNRKNLE